MESVQVSIREGIAAVTLARGKVNPVNGRVVDELREAFRALEGNPDVRALVFTGQGSFFSFGFDVPEFLSFSREEFTGFLVNFTDLYTELFLYPKPVIAALNGHTIAGGCMLALACDQRIMAGGRGRISLNEIAFGAAVFAGSTEMLRFCTGSANAARILYSGDMYTADEALALGLVDGVAAESDLQNRAEAAARDFGGKYGPAFAAVKSLLRQPVADDMIRRERASIDAFVDIWYSEHTWANVRNIKIR